MNKRQFTATGLRLTLTASLFVITIIGIAIFTIAYGQLQQVAVEVSHVVVDSTASQNNLTTLQKIKEKLVTDDDTVKRTSNIVAESQSYQYQDQILSDLNGFAGRAGIVITNIDFSPTKSTSPTKVPAALSGVKSTSVVVTLKNPVNYNNLLRFIESIEHNLTKMQVSKVSLSKSTAGNDITSDVLTIEVYVR